MNDFARKVIGLATTQIGVREHGRNRGPEIDGYNRDIGHDPTKADPWCAIFACAMVKRAADAFGVPVPIHLTAGVFTLDERAPVACHRSQPVAGSIFIKNEHRHTGLVEAVLADGSSPNHRGEYRPRWIFRGRRRLSAHAKPDRDHHLPGPVGASDRLKGSPMTLKEFLDGVDLVAARVRLWLSGTTKFMIAAQGAYAAGLLDKYIPPSSRYAKWVGFAGLFVALYTQRKGEAAALLAAKKIEAQPQATAEPPKP